MSKIPKNIGRYKIIKVLGKGAMGVVYKAQDPNIDRTVAIKAVHKAEFENSADGEELVERFKREIQTAGLLTHSNIVTVFDGGVDSEIHWIAMEYVDGSSLSDALNANVKFSVQEIITMMVQICSAMDMAHLHNIVHRDLKPANILLTKRREPKIGDFGIAHLESSTMTKTGIILGTPSYMSPEQITGKQLDKRSDIFSLGIILFELLTGQRPFTGDSPTSIMYQIVHSEPKNPRKFNPEIPMGLARIVLKAISKKPENRYQRANAMATDLVQFIGGDTEYTKSMVSNDMETAVIDSDDLLASMDQYQSADNFFMETQRRATRRKRNSVVFLSILVALITIAATLYYVFPEVLNSIPIVNSFLGREKIIKEIEVNSEMKDAEVIFDGKKVGITNGETIKVEGYKGDAYKIQYLKKYYEPVEEIVRFNDDLLFTGYFVPIRITKKIKLESDAPGTVISVNGVEIGVTPVEFEFTAGEELTIGGKAKGYNSISKKLTWEQISAEDTYKLSFTAISPGILTFQGAYKVNVIDDKGKVLGKMRDEISLPPGKYNIRLTNEAIFLNISREVDVITGKRSEISLPGMGSLTLHISPANGKVYVDGVDVTQNMPLMKMPIAAGSHKLRYDWGDKQEEETLQIGAGKAKDHQKRKDRN